MGRGTYSLSMHAPEQHDEETSAHVVSTAVMETVLLLMQTIRGEMRSHRPEGLSVPQFRALRFIQDNRGASLSNIADHVGVALSSMSKLVEGLVARELVTRLVATDDRRRITLELTEAGQAALGASHQGTQARFAQRLATLSVAERDAILQTMHTLHALFEQRDVHEHIERIETGP
jgi:DNA-binding MarR family transcriptional regulator